MEIFSSTNKQLYAGELGCLSGTQIRLLHVNPGLPGNPLDLTLVRADLKDDPIYDALSYTWGDVTDTVSVTCNSASVPVTRNLFEALHRLRTSEIRALWADAICINQQDATERATQVRLMYYIYCGAASVQAWLGPGNSSVKAVADLLASCPSPNRGLWSEEAFLSIAEDKEMHDARAWLASSPDFDELKQGIVTLFGSPWFDRVWIQQEAACNPNLYLIMGQWEFEWQHVFYLALMSEVLQNDQTAHSEEYVHKLPNVYSNKIRAVELNRAQMNDELAERLTLNFAALLTLAADCRATDPRDFVYAILNLVHAEDEVPFLLHPDYTIDVPELMFRTAESLVRMNQLEFLQVAGLHFGDDHSTPSWTPDYLSRGRSLEQPAQSISIRSGCKISVAQQAEEEAKRVLLCHGAVFEEVVWTCKDRLARISDNQISSMLRNFRDDLLDYVDFVGSIRRPRPNTLQDVFDENTLFSKTPRETQVQNMIESMNKRGINQSEGSGYKYDLVHRLEHRGARTGMEAIDALFNQFMMGYRLCVVGQGHVCIAPLLTRPGDLIGDVLGHVGSFVLRQEGDYHKIVGRCLFEDRKVGSLLEMKAPPDNAATPIDTAFREGVYAQSLTGVYGDFPVGWISFLLDKEVELFVPEGWQFAFKVQTINSDLQEVYYYHTATIEKTSQKFPSNVDELDARPLTDPTLLPGNWTVCSEHADDEEALTKPCFHHALLDIHTFDDPRYHKISLGPMVEGWRAGMSLETKRDGRDEFRERYADIRMALHFINTTTGEVTREDPCLAAGAEYRGFHGLRLI